MTSKSIKKTTRSEIIFFLNGQKQVVTGDDAFLSVAEWLRKKRLLTGTKIVCAEGDCGACTVLMAKGRNDSKEKAIFQPMNSCIISVVQIDGHHLVTVEGLAVDGELAPAQVAMKESHGSQCGFCTPGFVMVLAGASETKCPLTRKQAANAMTGNLCRCTGYSPILDSAEFILPSPKHSLKMRYLTKKNILNLRLATSMDPLITGADDKIFYAPSTIKEACNFLSCYDDVAIIGGGTDLGVQVNKGKTSLKSMLSLQNIGDLHQIHATQSSLWIGCNVTLEQVRIATKSRIPEFSRFLDLFASPQIKNVATLVGNLANASPIGDTLPFLLITDAIIHTVTLKGHRIQKNTVNINDFFRGYKKISLKKNEFIAAIEIPNYRKKSNLRLFKASQRKDLDISTTSAAFDIEADNKGIIKKAALAFGGMAATPIRLTAIEKKMLGQHLDPQLFALVQSKIAHELKPLSDLRGSSQYRTVIATQLFQHYTRNVLNIKSSQAAGDLP